MSSPETLRVIEQFWNVRTLSFRSGGTDASMQRLKDSYVKSVVTAELNQITKEKLFEDWGKHLICGQEGTIGEGDVDCKIAD